MHHLRAARSGLKLRRRNVVVVAASVVTVTAMVALSFAAVPLYRLFCQVTGLAGTTQIATSAPGAVGSKVVTVRFDANVAPGLAWQFVAPKPVGIRHGEGHLVAFTATNISDEPLLGTATFNVTPLQIGKLFNKIQCFCFTEQLLLPGESKAFPVSFFVDPSIAEDYDGQGVTAITLSYTFFNRGRPALEDYLRAHQAAVRATGAIGGGEGVER